MFSYRFLWKIYAGFAAVILLSSALLGVLVTRWIKSDSIDGIRSELQSQALLLNVIAEEDGRLKGDYLQGKIRELGKTTGARFTILDKDGVVIADSHEDPKLMDNHGNRPEILFARSHGEGSSTRYSDTLKTRMMYYALPMRRAGKISGYVRVSISLIKVDEKLSRLKNTVILGAGIAVIAALVLGYFLARNFSRPLESMTQVAESMSKGKYDEKLPENRDDEIGKLAKALNHMADSLRIRIETISGERNKLEAILAGMVEGVIAVRLDERIVHINKTASDIIGAPFTNIIGKPLWEVTYLQELTDILDRTLKDKTKVQKEIKVVGKQGERSIEVLSSPTFTTKNNISGAVMVLHDITELYSLERIRRDFVANVSHELKTPIAAIRGMIETIVDDEEMSRKDEKKFLTKIEKQSIRLSALVSDVLTVARLESDRSSIDKDVVDLGDMVDSVIRTFSSESESRGIIIHSDIPDEPVLVTGDEEALSQAISNLTDNALKYTASNENVYVRLKAGNGKAVIEVQDTGIGIEPKHQQRIFERFYRVDKARSRELGGTGLGLSIVKHVAISHGGTVEVKSEPGVGATFKIILPISRKFA